MEDRIRKYEQLFFRVLFILLMVGVSLGGGLYFLFQSNTGREILIERFISTFNDRVLGTISYEKLRGESGGLFIEDLNVADSTGRVLVHIDSLRTGVVLSSLFDFKLNVPQLGVFGIKLAKDIERDVFRNNFSSSVPDSTQKMDRIRSPLFSYIRQFTLTVKDIELAVNDEFSLRNLDGKETQFSELGLQIEYLEVSKDRVLVSLNELSSTIVRNGKDFSVFARGQVYGDSRDFELNNFQLWLDESYVHFRNRASNFSVDLQGRRIPSLVTFQVFDDSKLNWALLKKLGEFKSNQVADQLFGESPFSVAIDIRALPKAGEVEIDNVLIKQPFFEFKSYGNAMGLPNYRFGSLPNTFRSNLKATFNASITDSIFYDWLLKRNLNPSFFSDIEIRSDIALNSKTIEQQIIGRFNADTLSITHRTKAIGTDSTTHRLDFRKSGLALENLLYESQEIQLEGLKAALKLSGSPKNMEADVDMYASKVRLIKRDLADFQLNAKNTAESSLVEVSSKIGNGQIESAFELKKDSLAWFLDGKLDAHGIQPSRIILSEKAADHPIHSSLAISSRIDPALKQIQQFDAIFDASKDSNATESDRLRLSYSRLDQLRNNLIIDSPILSLNASGSFAFEDLAGALTNWVQLLQEASTDVALTKISEQQPYVINASVDGKIPSIDYLDLWLDEYPIQTFSSNFSFELEDRPREKKLFFTFFSEELQSRQVNWDSLSVKALYRFSNASENELIREATIDTDFGQLSVQNIPVKNVAIEAQLKNQDVALSYRTDEFIQNARLDFDINGFWGADSIHLELPYFRFGNETYGWKNADKAVVNVPETGVVDIEDLRLVNGNELIMVEGRFGKDPSDRVNYQIQNVDLGKLSELIQGRLPFSGLMNGRFTTGSLSEQPFFQGLLEVEQLALRNRLVGDVSLESRIDSSSNRFLAELKIESDSLKYPNSPTQNIFGKGFFQPIVDASEEDTLAYFDVEFEDFNLWILPSIAVNVFDSTSGRATGFGHIIAKGQGFDYQSFLSVDSAYAKPKFINTDYYLSGPINWNREQGIVVDTVLIDDSYGTGKFWGIIDLNDFQPEKRFDLTLELDNLQFMNNKFDEEVPFYGNIRGTGTVRLVGTNSSPTLSSLGEIRIEPGSEFKLPLLSETEFEGEKSFIRFTNDFSEPGKSAREVLAARNLPKQEVKTIFSRTINNTELTFNELFTLELLFSAPEETYIELIFDQVTNESMRAQGSGDISIALDDEDLKINGTYTLASGVYDFVTVDFFTRRFILEPGGQLTWDGDPTNAIIDISAVYQQRADFSPFLGTSANQSNLRIPVDMVLTLGGRLQQIQNDYYFRIPSEMEMSANTDLINNVISSINTEQYKLYQATSFLLTGSFLPIEGAVGGGIAGANRSVITNIQENPDALIAPLLSGQINSLMNSNLGNLKDNLEFDLNMATLDQIDVGVALRLFQDRLTIRRDQSIVNAPNQQNTIGDIGANYRINDQWSVLFFHRQDPLFSDVNNAGGQQIANTQVLNGVGLMWQQQFNSWFELSRKIERGFNKVFGKSSPSDTTKTLNQDLSTNKQ